MPGSGSLSRIGLERLSISYDILPLLHFHDQNGRHFFDIIFNIQ